jgi:hypothetical protein
VRRENGHINLLLSLVTVLAALFPGHPGLNAQDMSISFPSVQPKGGNFNRPSDGEIVDVTPPGFCWWRVEKKTRVSYQISILSEDGGEIHRSPLLNDPVYIPSTILAPGKYTWTVEALDAEGNIVALRKESHFEISNEAVSLPWIDPGKLLANVPRSHPRLLFPAEQLEEIRQNIGDRYREPYESLKKSADLALGIPLVGYPGFDTITGRKNYAAKRTAYREEYHRVGDTYIGGVVPMALTYLLDGDMKYGLAVKSHLLHLCSWSLDGSMSVQDPKFDEVGLRLARALPQAYDWTHDLFAPAERVRMENWMAALADSFLVRMKTRDFLYYSGESHDGRVPGYLMEFAIVLAEHPEAVAWMDYAMKAALTVWPHWAGSDGGWAEGVDYALQYNERFITPIQSVLTGTGYDLWQKPFFRKFPYFLTYCISPVGEITPFGDSEDQPASRRADKLESMLLYYAHINKDAGLRWWADLLSENTAGVPEEIHSAVRMLLTPDTIKPASPAGLSPDRAFMGIGWAAFHSDLASPENDLMLLFKSSPFGPVSHSHADQNSFAIMKGGKGLAIPAGERYPQHGSPFHTKYTRLTEAHNALLINGKGQIDKDARANGRIIDFKSLPHIGYAAGEAHLAYGPTVKKYTRHALLIRPSLILIIDEVETAEPAAITWLMHGKDKFLLDVEKQQIIASRGNESMKIMLWAEAGFAFSQSDEWPVDPKEGYPMVQTESPENQWHFYGRHLGQGNGTVIAALMSAEGSAGYPGMDTVKKDSGKKIKISSTLEGGGRVDILLNPGTRMKSKNKTLARVRYRPQEGKKEKLIIHRSINH